jgi:hypothetical protein
MNDSPVNPNNMIETSDSLEAVGVFRAWKNIFFAIVLICLLLNQAAFWAVDQGFVEASEVVEAAEPVKAADAGQGVAAASPAEPNLAEDVLLGGLIGNFTLGRLVGRVIGVANGILIVSGILFALTVFFCLMVSLVGRLGGINHIARAFILALIMAALIIPWQTLFGSSVTGVAYWPNELQLPHWLEAKDVGMPNVIFYYLRFTGLWIIVLLLLIMSQVRSSGWSKSILRRLEII